jgi:hypothetical protein
MRRLVGVVVTVVAAALALPLGGASAAGASITQVGWWSQRPGASELPKGGFELALAPTGALSQAAMRIEVDAVQLNSALVVLLESSAAGAEAASVLACPTTADWTAANPGAWNERPTPNCNKSVPLSRSFDGDWSGDIRELLSLGTVSIVLVPASHPDTQGAPIPYQIVFENARLLASAPAAPSTPAPRDGGAPVITQAPPRRVTAPEAPQSGTAGGPPAVVAEPEPTEAPADDDFPQALDDTEQVGSNRPWWRLVILLPLASLVGVAAVYTRRMLRERGLAGT